MNYYRTLLMIMAICLVGTSAAIAQSGKIKRSQPATVTQTIARSVVTVDYSRPVARGRPLFGPKGIIKYDKIWMPGANDASYIKFTSDVTVNGKPLKAGSYSFWTIPGAGKWTVIMSSDWDQFHTAYPGKEKDAARFEIKPEEGDHMETLAFYFPVVTVNSAILRLHWGKTIVPMEIILAK
jgi:hypothetical protein